MSVSGRGDVSMNMWKMIIIIIFIKYENMVSKKPYIPWENTIT